MSFAHVLVHPHKEETTWRSLSWQVHRTIINCVVYLCEPNNTCSVALQLFVIIFAAKRSSICKKHQMITTSKTRVWNVVYGKWPMNEYRWGQKVGKPLKKNRYSNSYIQTLSLLLESRQSISSTSLASKPTGYFFHCQ